MILLILVERVSIMSSQIWYTNIDTYKIFLFVLKKSESGPLKNIAENIDNQKEHNKGIKKSDFKKLALTETLDDKYDRDCCCCS